MSGIAVAHRTVRPKKPDPFFYGWREVWSRDENGLSTFDNVPLTEEDVLHPREGDHVVQTELHEVNREYLKNVLRARLEDRPDTFVYSDCGVDFQLGFKNLCPDLMVVSSPHPVDVMSALLPVRDKEATVHMVVELTSPSTRKLDLTEKVQFYFRAGVPHYLIVDNHFTKRSSKTSFLWYRPGPGGPELTELDSSSRIRVPFFNIDMTHEKGRLICFDDQGREYPNVAEALRRYDEARKQFESATAETQRERAKADTERVRADALALELAELKAKISPP